MYSLLAALGPHCCVGLLQLRWAVEGRVATLQLWCEGFSLRQLLLMHSTGSRVLGLSSCSPRLESTGWALLGLRCSEACVLYLDGGSNPRLSHWQVDSLPLSHQGSPRILEWVAYPFSSGSSRPRNRTGVSCIAGRFFINWAMTEEL